MIYFIFTFLITNFFDFPIKLLHQLLQNSSSPLLIHKYRLLYAIHSPTTCNCLCVVAACYSKDEEEECELSPQQNNTIYLNRMCAANTSQNWALRESHIPNRVSATDEYFKYVDIYLCCAPVATLYPSSVLRHTTSQLGL